MIKAIPLECAVHSDAYPIIKKLLGEEVAHALLYEPWRCPDDRYDHGTAAEASEGRIRMGLRDHRIALAPEEIEETAAQRA